jgi:DNA mismatch repair protein MutL
MPRVRRLDPEVAGRIAAGEVIEHPASVVKELIENALDAGAGRIDIDIQNGGRRLIQVTDNGTGMPPEDAVLALQRFTTSKLERLDDLRMLTTLGFRGEALASMATVAEVDIYTRTAEQQAGVLVRSRGGEEPRLEPVGCPVGTRVCVHHLFTYAPVRLRALKSISREVQRIQEVVSVYALAHYGVTWHLRHDGRRLLFAPACTSLGQRLPLVCGRELAAQMLPVAWHSADLHIDGAIGLPGVSRATRQRQYFWVNGRPIRSGLLGAAVERAYGGLLQPGRHAVVVLGLEMAPEMLDVNVHPRKTEVTFLHQRAVFVAVQEAVEMALQRLPSAGEDWQQGFEPGDWDDSAFLQQAVREPRQAYDAPPGRPAVVHALGQVAQTYVVAHGPQGLVLIDQHAAHEALLYERLMSSDDSGIELEEACVLHLRTDELRWVDAVGPALASLGLRLEPFGREARMLRHVPAALHDRLDAAVCLEALQEARRRIRPHMSPEEVGEQLGAALACRTAWRAGDALTAEQIDRLVGALAAQHLPFTCPHGRPTYVTLTLAELERRFLRLFPLDTSAGGC